MPGPRDGSPGKAGGHSSTPSACAGASLDCWSARESREVSSRQPASGVAARIGRRPSLWPCRRQGGGRPVLCQPGVGSKSALPRRYHLGHAHRARPPIESRHPAARGRARGALARASRHDPCHRGRGLRLGVGRRTPSLPVRGPAATRSVGSVDARSPRSPRPPRGSSSARSSPAPTSTTRPCWPSRRPPSMRSAAAASSSASAPAGTRPSSVPSATRSTTGSTASRRRSRSSGRFCATAPSTSTGASTRLAIASCSRADRDRTARR